MVIRNNNKRPEDPGRSLKKEVSGISTDAIQVLEGRFQPRDETLLSLSQPYAGIVVFLVGLVCTLRIAKLSLQICFVLHIKLVNTLPESPLQIRIQIHLDRAISNGFAYLILR